jgi:4-oxalmesaconate hydratase
MIIDCHGHFTTAPPAHSQWRAAQLAAFEGGLEPPPYPEISDEDLREAIEGRQLELMDDRGVDVTLLSPRASAMGHHLGDERTSRAWAQRCNDLVHRVAVLFPGRFLGVCQLPQTPVAPIAGAVDELRRCVEELGFVACNLNPDPSGGRWSAPSLTDPSWFPLYEAMVELDVPAMVHASSSTVPLLHTTGPHYLNTDTAAFMQLLEGSLFSELPGLRLVIPHGGGAAPYHWGRFRGLADMLERPAVEENVMTNCYFDTCVYHQAGIDLLLGVVDRRNVVFGSEAIGAVRGVDPTTGHHFDDTRRYIEAADLTPEERAAVYEGNVRLVYPRIGAALPDEGPLAGAGGWEPR